MERGEDSPLAVIITAIQEAAVGTSSAGRYCAEAIVIVSNKNVQFQL